MMRGDVASPPPGTGASEPSEAGNLPVWDARRPGHYEAWYIAV